MRWRNPTSVAVTVALGTLAGTAPGVAGCSPGVGPSCIGEVAKATQPYRFGRQRPALVKAGARVPAGARYCLIGQSRIGRKLWFYVSNSDLMLDGADLALPTGCALDTLDTSEPD